MYSSTILNDAGMSNSKHCLIWNLQYWPSLLWYRDHIKKRTMAWYDCDWCCQFSRNIFPSISGRSYWKEVLIDLRLILIIHTLDECIFYVESGNFWLYPRLLSLLLVLACLLPLSWTTPRAVRCGLIRRSACWFYTYSVSRWDGVCFLIYCPDNT